MTDLPKILCRCPAKVNLGLAVLGRREDGFHEVETVLAAISLGDSLTVQKADTKERAAPPAHPAPGIRLIIHGPPGLPTDRRNLVWRAAEAFAAAAETKPGWRFEISKHVPPGSGLGGGSSDAAGTLVALNRLHGSPLSPEKMREVAAALGSDVPFFLEGGIALATGRGEKLAQLGSKARLHLVLAFPRAAVSTTWAYKQLSEKDFRPLPREEITAWLASGPTPRELPNAFEEKITRAFGVIGRTLEILRASGLAPVSLSGSGSSCFGVARDEKEAFRIAQELESHSIAAVPTEVIDKGVRLVENEKA